MGDLGSLRAKKVDDVSRALGRPGMFAVCGQDLQFLVMSWLDDLCFIDERVGELERVAAVHGRYGKLGINGAFANIFGDGRYHDEVSSVLAQTATRLGYLDLPGPRVAPADWDALQRSLRDQFEDRDATREAVLSGLPEPSFTVGRVASFAPTDTSSSWVHLDFASERTSTYDHVTGKVVARTGEALLRDIRLPTEHFLDGLILTNYGRHLRWGPGSWIDQSPHRDSTPQQHAIAEKLRSIRAVDPSQVLRRPNL